MKRERLIFSPTNVYIYIYIIYYLCVYVHIQETLAYIVSLSLHIACYMSAQDKIESQLCQDRNTKLSCSETNNPPPHNKPPNNKRQCATRNNACNLLCNHLCERTPRVGIRTGWGHIRILDKAKQTRESFTKLLERAFTY